MSEGPINGNQADKAAGRTTLLDFNRRTGGLVQRSSGLLVPADANHIPAPEADERDQHGRIRRTWLPDMWRKTDKALAELKASGLGIVVMCRTCKGDVTSESQDPVRFGCGCSVWTVRG